MTIVLLCKIPIQRYISINKVYSLEFDNFPIFHLKPASILWNMYIW